MICGPSKDSDQPVHLCSLIRVFSGHSNGSQGPIIRVLHVDWPDLGSDCVDVQADLSLCRAHRSFCRVFYALAYLQGSCSFPLL